MARRNLNWQRDILPVAQEIVKSYDTPVTLRQLFYRLVAIGLIENVKSSYTYLSRITAELRAAGDFPDLAESGRGIHQVTSFTSPDDAQTWLRDIYRRDRTEGQKWNILLAVEKAGMREQLIAWFGEFGLPIIAMEGYSSVTLKKKLTRLIQDDGRPSALIYAGDFDPSGVDIDRDVTEWVAFDRIERIGLNIDQIVDLPTNPYPSEKRDTRRASFEARFGDQLETMGLPRIVQYELDALAPEEIRRLYRTAIDEFWDSGTWGNVIDREDIERNELFV